MPTFFRQGVSSDVYITYFCHIEVKFDKSVSTLTLHQPPFLYINLRQVEITQICLKKSSSSLCQK